MLKIKTHTSYFISKYLSGEHIRMT